MIKRTTIRDWHRIRHQRTVFPPVNDPRQHPRRPALFVNILGSDQLLHQPLLIIGIQNRKSRLQTNQFRMATQQFCANRMERAQPRHPLHRFAHHAPHPQLHLAGGLIGKRHRQNLIRPRRPRGQQMADPRG